MRRPFLLLLLLLAVPASAQFVKHPPDVTAAQLPACNAGKAGRLLSVNDGNSTTDCSTGGGSNLVLCFCDGSSWAVPPSTATASPAGSTTEVQFNQSGSMGAESAFVWDFTNDELEVTGSIVVGNSSPLSSSAFSVDGSSDVVQLLVQGNATQTANIFEIETSAGTDMLTFGASGLHVIDASGDGEVRVETDDATANAQIYLVGGSPLAEWEIRAVGSGAFDEHFEIIDPLGSSTAPFQIEPAIDAARVYIGSSGVGIGETSPDNNFEVSGGTILDGNADEVQLLVQGNATQTANIFEIETSAAVDKFTVANDGTTTIDTELTTQMLTIKGGYNAAGDESTYDFGICDQDDTGRCIGMVFGTDEEEGGLGGHDIAGNWCIGLKYSVENGLVSLVDDATCGGGSGNAPALQGQVDADSNATVLPNKNDSNHGIGAEANRLEFYVGTQGAGAENIAITSSEYGMTGTGMKWRRATASPTSNPESNAAVMWYEELATPSFLYRDDAGTDYNIWTDQHGALTQSGLTWNVTAATCTGDGTAGALTVNGSNEIVCSADDGGAGGSGDAIEIEDGDNAGTFTAIDTTARFDDSGDINFAVADGGAGGPDIVTATVRADSVALATDTTGDYVQNITAGAGLSSTGATSGENIAHTLSTASTEAAFLTDGGVTALTCGAGNGGKAQVMDNGSFQYCDGATTSVVRNAMTLATAQNVTGAKTFSSNSLTVTGTNWTNANHAHAAANSGGQIAISDTTGTLAVARGGTGTTTSTGTGSVVLSASPALTGDPTVPTASANDNDTSAASTAYVQGEINGAGGTGLTCASGQCNVDLGTSISSAEIDADTIVAADVDASLDTRYTEIIWEDPADTDEFVVKLPPVTGTMTRIDCETVGATSITIKVCDGEDVGDDTCSTNILDATETTTLTCTDAEASDTALNSAGFVARDKVTIVVTAVSGTPQQAIVYITSTVD